MSGAICSGSSQRSQHTTLTSFAKQYPRLEEDYQTSITGRRHGRLCRPEPAPPVGDGAALAAPRQIPRNVAFGQGGQSHVTRRLSDHGVGANVCCGVCRLRWVPVARRLRVHPTRSRSRCTRPTRRARSAYRAPRTATGTSPFAIPRPVHSPSRRAARYGATTPEAPRPPGVESMVDGWPSTRDGGQRACIWRAPDQLHGWVSGAAAASLSANYCHHFSPGCRSG